jgi:hypothetical protein
MKTFSVLIEYAAPNGVVDSKERRCEWCQRTEEQLDIQLAGVLQHVFGPTCTDPDCTSFLCTACMNREGQR